MPDELYQIRIYGKIPNNIDEELEKTIEKLVKYCKKHKIKYIHPMLTNDLKEINYGK